VGVDHGIWRSVVQQVSHTAVAREHLETNAVNAPLSGRMEESLQQDPPEAALLQSIHDRDGDLCDVWLVGESDHLSQARRFATIALAHGAYRKFVLAIYCRE
jgi:hypothetical protein